MDKNTSDQEGWECCDDDRKINPDEYDTLKMKEPIFIKKKAEMCCCMKNKTKTYPKASLS